jgi:hypothetical protein
MADRKTHIGAASLFAATLSLIAMTSLSSTPVLAHCDGLDGPVVSAAQAALQSGDVDRVLIWVHPEETDEIKHAFEETLVVRKLNPQAQALADRYFFETLVRLHRAGENAPYTGLKPAGRDLGPAIPAADGAIATGSADAVIQLLTDKIREGLRAHFQEVVGKKQFLPNDVTAGREYVEAYVTYIHYAERLYEGAERSSQGHYPDTD